MNETLKEQILKVRDTSLCNMFDTGMVKAIAKKLNCMELVEYINSNPNEYAHFILHGDK